MATPPVRTLVIDDEPLAREHLRALLSSRDDITVIGECGDGASAIARIRADAPELLLLDVQMPEGGGFDVVRGVGVDRMPAVIFVTAYDQHALAAFEVHAVDYLLKPVNRARFAKAIERVVRLLRPAAETPMAASARPASEPVALAKAMDAIDGARAGADRLTVRAGERMLYLRMQDIDWVEAADDVARLHVGKQVFEHRVTLSQLEQRLPSRTFVRVHRSAIVNVERIREFQPWFQGDWIIVLADGTRVQTGKSYRARVRELIGA
ncbi:MAG: response regulator transcription factor [Gemmatimonadetes bacterium]|jgi:two-component system LytT family response regulator|nr:response regulator transcription factor [Gemmatimonadota bacterium]